jgi:hypothetical protein
MLFSPDTNTVHRVGMRQPSYLRSQWRFASVPAAQERARRAPPLRSSSPHSSVALHWCVAGFDFATIVPAGVDPLRYRNGRCGSWLFAPRPASRDSSSIVEAFESPSHRVAGSVTCAATAKRDVGDMRRET